eukprot:Rhum_TRINITY_DN14766_c6_g1::Rhum_TRINITY_DN14766_c6_g1_i1::g.115023::m.115023/K11855/USP36_42; ubiquitin carboxyl-terminal hydrolase 36/42
MEEREMHACGQHAAPVSSDHDLSSVVAAFKDHVPNVDGLPNRGNTCYVNAVLQCLLKGTPLAAALHHPASPRHRCPNESPARPRPCYICLLRGLSERWGAPATAAVCDGVASIGAFRRNRQEDGHEFFRKLVDHLTLVYVGAHDRRTAALEQTTLPNRLFGGWLRSSVACGSCGAVSNVYQPFIDLQIPLQQPSLVDNLTDMFTCPDRLSGYRCAACGVEGRAEKRLGLHACPPALVVQLQRFQHTAHGTRKERRPVPFPRRLDLQPFISNDCLVTPTAYELSAYVLHSGPSMHSGHYTAVVHQRGAWVHYNDEHARHVSEEVVLRQNPYLLVYLRQDCVPTPLKVPLVPAAAVAATRKVRRTVQLHQQQPSPSPSSPTPTPPPVITAGEREFLRAAADAQASRRARSAADDADAAAKERQLVQERARRERRYVKPDSSLPLPPPPPPTPQKRALPPTPTLTPPEQQAPAAAAAPPPAKRRKEASPAPSPRGTSNGAPHLPSGYCVVITPADAVATLPKVQLEKVLRGTLRHMLNVSDAEVVEVRTEKVSGRSDGRCRMALAWLRTPALASAVHKNTTASNVFAQIAKGSHPFKPGTAFLPEGPSTAAVETPQTDSPVACALAAAIAAAAATVAGAAAAQSQESAGGTIAGLPASSDCCAPATSCGRPLGPIPVPRAVTCLLESSCEDAAFADALSSVAADARWLVRPGVRRDLRERGEGVLAGLEQADCPKVLAGELRSLLSKHTGRNTEQQMYLTDVSLV